MSDENNLLQKIRDLREILHGSFVYKQGTWDQRSEGNWSKLWASFDNISDSQLAIDEAKYSKTITHLTFYGLQQALIIQQDSLKHIEESLCMTPPDLHQALKEIRNVRIETAGHPSKIGLKGQPKSYASISRDFSQKKVRYILSGHRNEHKVIDINQTIRKQENVMLEEIERIITKINEAEKDHMDKFRGQKLMDIFSHSSHSIQYLWPSERERSLSKIHLKMIKESLIIFEEAIKERYRIESLEDAIVVPGLIYELEQVHRFLPRIESKIHLDGSVDELDLEVYVRSLDLSIASIKEMAEEIDNEFSGENIN